MAEQRLSDDSRWDAALLGLGLQTARLKHGRSRGEPETQHEDGGHVASRG